MACAAGLPSVPLPAGPRRPVGVARPWQRRQRLAKASCVSVRFFICSGSAVKPGRWWTTVCVGACYFPGVDAWGSPLSPLPRARASGCRALRAATLPRGTRRAVRDPPLLHRHTTSRTHPDDVAMRGLTVERAMSMPPSSGPTVQVPRPAQSEEPHCARELEFESPDGTVAGAGENLASDEGSTPEAAGVAPAVENEETDVHRTAGEEAAPGAGTAAPSVQPGIESGPPTRIEAGPPSRDVAVRGGTAEEDTAPRSGRGRGERISWSERVRLLAELHSLALRRSAPSGGRGVAPCSAREAGHLCVEYNGYEVRFAVDGSWHLDLLAQVAQHFFGLRTVTYSLGQKVLEGDRTLADLGVRSGERVTVVDAGSRPRIDGPLLRKGRVEFVRDGSDGTARGCWASVRFVDERVVNALFFRTEGEDASTREDVEVGKTIWFRWKRDRNTHAGRVVEAPSGAAAEQQQQQQEQQLAYTGIEVKGTVLSYDKPGNNQPSSMDVTYRRWTMRKGLETVTETLSKVKEKVDAVKGVMGNDRVVMPREARLRRGDEALFLVTDGGGVTRCMLLRGTEVWPVDSEGKYVDGRDRKLPAT
eukprot:TRINITY_DN101_c0_g1_i5.p1 TRINITY_DN101_c0_g1~~TRINITY_DN101_c0_g1_i5.p1  ORF type:complete len:589 (+),score=81.55 TRINITY_DN101_c0_g1_i5:1067-2833(+)